MSSITVTSSYPGTRCTSMYASRTSIESSEVSVVRSTASRSCTPPAPGLPFRRLRAARRETPMSGTYTRAGS